MAPKMAPKMGPKKAALLSFEERVTEAWLEDAQKVAERIASESGAPPGSDRVSASEAVTLWGLADPAVEYQQVVTQLLTAGIPPEQAETLVFLQERPEDERQQWLELLAQPVPDSTVADQVARLLEYPFRASLVFDVTDDPEEQTRLAEQYQRAWEREQEAARARLPTLPAPTLPAPTLPAPASPPAAQVAGVPPAEGY